MKEPIATAVQCNSYVISPPRVGVGSVCSLRKPLCCMGLRLGLLLGTHFAVYNK